jgi:excisionase family DNA binding protein
MHLFTTSEAAQYLRLKERKIYEMVAEGTIPCTKVTGRWLFPKAELDHWLAASVQRPPGLPHPEPAPIVAGSHDPLLEWALRESGCGLATLAVGSEAGLARFLTGEAIAAGMHLHALDDLEGDANVAALKARSDVGDAVLIGFCRREQGFLVPSGNPMKIRTIEDAAERRARICMGRRAPARSFCCWPCSNGPRRRSKRCRQAPCARPAPTSPRRSAPAVPMSVSPRARSPTPPASISCRSSGSRSIF